MNNVERIGRVIGRPVVSFGTANRLGSIADLLIDPLSGELAGLAVKRADQTTALVSILDVHGFGPDAVIVDGDECLVLAEASPLQRMPKAKQNLTGVKIITEHGQVVGSISDHFLCIARRPFFIYEARSSLFDKLLGRAFYFAASLGCAFSADRTALIISAGPEQMDHRVEAVAERLLVRRVSGAAVPIW